jgi:hypothetical protein
MNKKNFKAKTPRKSSQTDGNRSTPNQITRIPRTVDLLFPDRLQLRLEYNGVGAQTVSIAASHTAFRYRPSAAYDVDPVLGSTTMPGFTELAGIYNSYRVTKSKFRFEIVSNDARTGSVVLIPLNTDPTGAPGATTVESWPMNPYRVYKMIPPTGARPAILEKTMSTEKIFGSKAVYFDDNFMSLTNTIPNNIGFGRLEYILLYL